jgi:hypothetical protein
VYTGYGNIMEYISLSTQCGTLNPSNWLGDS